MTSIYQIDQNIKNLLDDLPETGEFSNEELHNYEELQMQRAEKQKNTILYYKSIEATELAVNAELERFQKLKASLAKKKQRIADLIAYSMDQGKQLEVDFVTCKAKFKKNPPKVVILDEAELPKDYVSVEVKEVTKIDKKAIKEAVKSGREVPGAEVVQEQRLTIS